MFDITESIAEKYKAIYIATATPYASWSYLDFKFILVHPFIDYLIEGTVSIDQINKSLLIAITDVIGNARLSYRAKKYIRKAMTSVARKLIERLKLC